MASDFFDRDINLERVASELASIRADLLTAEQKFDAELRDVASAFRASALNLLHYLMLRRRDLRPLQTALAELGLSSLGRAESHVLFTIDAVLRLLGDGGSEKAPPSASAIDFAQGRSLLDAHTEALLGERPSERGVRIMVTMPSEAATDYSLVHDLLREGMDCMRINCAHDDADAWLAMIRHLRRAEAALHKTCRIAMDLAGPKIRTGPLAPGPAVAKIRPCRDPFGRVVAPGRLWLTDCAQPTLPPTAAGVSLFLPSEWLRGLTVGDRVEFEDTRGADRVIRIADVTPLGVWGLVDRTCYLSSETELKVAGHNDQHTHSVARVGTLPARPGVIRLYEGDTLILARTQLVGCGATRDAAGHVLTPAIVSCTLPEVFECVQAGERVWFDDGKLGGVVERIEQDLAYVRIDHARPTGTKLGSDKGINLPDTQLRFSALTPKDREDLRFAAHYADIASLSFVSDASDVDEVRRELAELGRPDLGLVLKIETRRGFENLPALLLAAMRLRSCGVMIARGDLAVECGFERLAEVQEEILWLSEAAHVPVIWATQVLESLAKEGIPSRAEITDAAMGHRAECVMLNKGPHIRHAVRVLDDILRRMQAHQTKKSAMLRELKLATQFVGSDGAEDSAE